jgi:hypothetical protein
MKLDITYKLGLVFDKNGCRAVISGAVKLTGLEGAGTLHIRTVSSLDRNFILKVN